MKRRFKYLIGAKDPGISYPRGDNFDFVGYSNVDYIVYKVDRLNYSGPCQCLRYSQVPWHSRNYNSAGLSTTEAEYIVVRPWYAQILRISQQLRGLGLD